MKRFAWIMLAVLLLGALEGCTPKTPTRKDTNEIAVGIAQDLSSSLSPYELSTAGTREIMFNVFEGLYKAAPDGSFVPALATGVEISADNLTYTFTLRDGVTFHNGAKLTAADVVWSYQTCAEKSVDANVKAALAGVAEIKEDGGKVVITLSSPNSDFLTYVGSVYISPKDYAEQETAPVGTGPFRYVSRRVQENIVLERFDNYWGEKAKVQKVTFKIYETNTAQVTALDSGAVDIFAHLTNTQIAGLSKDYNILEGTMNLVQALYLNNAIEPFNDVRVRQALCYAVDVDQMLALTAQGHGAKLGSSIYPSFARFFDASLIDLYPHDVAKAKELLAQAGYPDGFTMTIKVPSNYTPHVNTATVLAEQLKEVGITVNVKEIDWNTWLTEVYQGRDFEGTVCGFDASTLTAGALLNRYVSDSKKNMIGFANAEYDAKIAEASSITDEARRTELYKAAARILAEEAANVYLQDLAEFVAIRSNLEGFRFYPLYLLDLSQIAYK